MRSVVGTVLAVAWIVMAVGCAGDGGKDIQTGTETETTARTAAAARDAPNPIDAYAHLVYRNYKDAHRDAVELREAIDRFLADPTERTMEAAKEAWLASRESYGQTEAFRFYEGPIDFADPDTGEEGPEGRLNAWPLNEAYIDAVRGDPDAGIVNAPDVEIDAETLIGKNAADDEANVTTGYHAIEFLLWGQDFNAAGPGDRPVEDYIGEDETTARRRAYLRAVTDLLVEDLEFLVNEWEPGRPDNYAAEFREQDRDEALSDILTGLATLSGFEMASERIAVPLMSGDQEDEHSCFSDNTHNDYVYNARGIANVYLGDYGGRDGTGLNTRVAEADPQLNERIERQIRRTVELTESIEPPVDQILAGERPAEREKLERLVTAFQEQAVLLVEAGEALGVNVEVLAE